MYAMNTMPMWGQITDTPTPVTSQFGHAEYMAEFQFQNGSKVKVYWKAGGLSDRLQPGEWILLEQGQNQKWKISKTQAPEVIKKLQERPAPGATLPPTAPPASIAAAPPTSPPGARPAGRSLDDDCQEMVMIWFALRRAIAEAPDECIQAMACTIWIQRNRK